jgi:hypothetical protein
MPESFDIAVAAGALMAGDMKRSRDIYNMNKLINPHDHN